MAMSALGRMFRPEGSIKELSGSINIARISGMVIQEIYNDVITNVLRMRNG